jgi:hypothetical protein
MTTVKKATVKPTMALSDVDKLFELAKTACHPDIFRMMNSIVVGKERARKEEAWHDAMRECQKEMGPISKDAANGATRSKYATLAALDEVLRPIYCKHGFDVTFDTEPLADGSDSVKVTLDVTHTGGWQKTFEIEMPCDGKGAGGRQMMTRTHAMGSATTYGRRYLLTMAFNISTVDDDGNAASARPEQAEPAASVAKVSEEQVDTLISLCDEVGANKRLLCAYLSSPPVLNMKIGSIADIPAAAYERVLKQLRLKQASNASKQQA